MMLRSIISSRLFLAGLSMAALIGCSKKTVDANPSIEYTDEDSAPTKTASHKSGKLKVTFINERAKLEYTIDPNDEDLFIQLSSQPKTKKPSKSKSSEPISPQQPMQITQNVSTPSSPQAEEKGSEPKDFAEELRKQLEEEKQEEDKVGIPEEDATDRVLSDIRKAQKALYNNELGNAEKLVRNSLGIRETAEGFALLGTIHYMRKDNRRALDAWQRSLSLDPSNQQIKDMIYKVEKKAP